jgi:hypothetical protein
MAEPGSPLMGMGQMAVVMVMRFTTLDEAVVSAEPTWMMKTAFGSPCPSRVSVPVMRSVEVEL